MCTGHLSVVLLVSGSTNIVPAGESQGGSALPALQCLLDHVLPLVIWDLLGPWRHTERWQGHSCHCPLHQLHVVYRDTGNDVKRLEVCSVRMETRGGHASPASMGMEARLRCAAATSASSSSSSLSEGGTSGRWSPITCRWRYCLEQSHMA